MWFLSDFAGPEDCPLYESVRNRLSAWDPGICPGRGYDTCNGHGHGVSESLEGDFDDDGSGHCSCFGFEDCSGEDAFLGY